MTIIPYGDSALLVNFEQRIDAQVNSDVINLSELVRKLKGVTFIIPAYCSLTIGYNFDLTDFHQLSGKIKKLKFKNSKEVFNSRIIKIPVCYSASFGLDLNELEGILGLPVAEIIKLHTQSSYRVFMIGFVAGFAYMGTLSEKLNSPRKQEPRLKVPQGSVGLAGLQTGIYPTEAPGGWQIIGRTPVPTFDPRKKSPVVLKPGDQISFYQIDEHEFESIASKVVENNYELEVVNG